MTKIGFVSLGCSKNLVDTEVMLRYLVDAGYEITPEEIEADIIVVNTCGFINSAKEEAIENILDLAWLKKNRNLKGIIATGCLAERYREQIFEEMPEVDALIGVGSLPYIVDAVRAVERGEKYSRFEDKEKAKLGGERVVTTPEYTAYLKIAEGCDNRCTYCAIPLIRGSFRSRTIEDIVKEAKDLEELGVKELNLIAQDTTRYGLDIYGEYKLAELVRAICKETEIPWIRLLYCYPDKITDDLINELKTNDRLVKYMDIPVQHISDRILSKMNRHGNQALIKDTISKLRREVPEITLRTTVIVGFPSESEKDFEELCNFISETKFDRFGAFTYSPEEDTPAATFDDQIDEQIKQDRYDTIMQLQLDISEKNNRKKVGKIIPVLCEGFDPVSEAHYGRSQADAPDVDGKIYFTADKRVEEGAFVYVKIEETLDYDLVGKKVNYVRNGDKRK
ncbi:MAG: 30S ribosomal protein S12 methylthiotransferase RimO [Clostridia bacterium]|nr:30S ribosomal protein S12 methylthiotransferase RimO [Clostridia bacterium]